MVAGDAMTDIEITRLTNRITSLTRAIVTEASPVIDGIVLSRNPDGTLNVDDGTGGCILVAAKQNVRVGQKIRISHDPPNAIYKLPPPIVPGGGRSPDGSFFVDSSGNRYDRGGRKVHTGTFGDPTALDLAVWPNSAGYYHVTTPVGGGVYEADSYIGLPPFTGSPNATDFLIGHQAVAPGNTDYRGSREGDSEDHRGSAALTFLDTGGLDLDHDTSIIGFEVPCAPTGYPPATPNSQDGWDDLLYGRMTIHGVDHETGEVLESTMPLFPNYDYVTNWANQHDDAYIFYWNRYFDGVAITVYPNPVFFPDPADGSFWVTLGSGGGSHASYAPPSYTSLESPTPAHAMTVPLTFTRCWNLERYQGHMINYVDVQTASYGNSGKKLCRFP